jgi:hypothetical protein
MPVAALLRADPRHPPFEPRASSPRRRTYTRAPLGSGDRLRPGAAGGPGAYGPRGARADEAGPEDTEITVGNQVRSARIRRLDDYAPLEVRVAEEMIICMTPADLVDGVALDVMAPTAPA